MDVALPETWDTAQKDAASDDTEANARLGAAFTTLTSYENALQTAVNAVPLDEAAIRTAMRNAAKLGVASAFPAFVAGTQEGGVAPLSLVQQATSALSELQSRVSAYNAAVATNSDLQTRARAIFGRDFQLLTGFSFSGATGAELGQATAYGPTMLSGDKRTVDRWLTGVMRVREPLGRWRMLRLLTEAGGAAPADWSVAQLPHDPTASWIALPPNPNESRISGKLSLVLNAQSTVDFTQPTFGLFIDEWVETIPNASEHTGLMFRHDDTAGEAPQTILVAVPPKLTQYWDFDSLLAIVNETLDLAKVRATDLEALEPYAQLIPAIFLAANAGDSAISSVVNVAFDTVRAERGAM